MKIEATRFFAGVARDVLLGSCKRELKGEVTDEWRPVLEACLVFAAVLLI